MALTLVHRDEAYGESATLPHPGVLAQEIVEDLEAVLEQFRLIAEDAREERGPTRTELS